MGTGDRILVMEENLKKIWILMNLNYFDVKDDAKEKLLEMIREYLKKPINQNVSNLEKINEQIAHIKETLKIDLIDKVKDLELEREDNGYAHKVMIGTGAYVYSDPQ